MKAIAEIVVDVIVTEYSNGSSVSYSYDHLGNSETYGYDLNDNLISVTDRKGRAFSYTYDLMDRMTRAGGLPMAGLLMEQALRHITLRLLDL